MRTPSLRLTNDYARGVTKGKIPACEWVVKACQRHLDDLSRAKSKCYPYEFSKERAARVVNFIERLPHTKGRWAAKRKLITLEPWQCFFFGALFGWIRKADGARRFREAYLEVPRKNGKSVKGAGAGLYCLLADGEYGAEVYSGATTEKQAWEVFRPARLMAKNAPGLSSHFGLEVNASNLLRLEDYAKFEPLIGNPGDGSSPHCAIVDEYHEHKSSDLFDTMQTGMGAREQPLMLVITTAGANIGGPCYEKRLEVQKVLSGVFDDDRLFGLIYTLDEGDDWTDPKMWAKANPNLGVSVSEDFIAAQVSAALRSPSKQSSVKTKHFNIWVGAKNAWINMEQWAACADPALTTDRFRGSSAILGLDLATRIDVAARVDLFHQDVDGQRHYYAFPTFYVPESALLESKNAKMYAGWAESGYITVMDGEEIELSRIEEDVRETPERYGVQELAYDPWQATQLAQNLRAENVEAVEFRNTVGNMSPAMRELEAAIAGGRFHHPDNPVLNWMASNVVAKEDAKENIFPRKELPENKIDGMIALIMAIGRAIHGEPAVISPWENPEFSIVS